MLIAFEGLDQSGKETQASHLRARLEQDGHKVRSLSFPDYGTPIGKEIQQALAGERHFGADVIQLLYVANRLEFKPRIETWLAAGDVVICDRYRASSVAYGEAQGLDPAWLETIQVHLPPATITLLLDLPPETSAARKQIGRDRFERDMPLLTRVRASYRRQASAPDWFVVNADQPKDAVSAAVQAVVLPRLAPA